MEEFFKYAFIFIVVALVARAFSPSKSKGGTALTGVPEKPKDVEFSFVAMQYYNLIMNRTVKVYLTKDYLYGAEVGGLVSAQMGQMGEEWKDPEFYVDNKWESDQLKKGLGSPEFLKKKGNFAIARADISHVDFKSYKFGMANIPYSGKLIVVQRNGKKTELILLGKQDSDAVKRRIEG